MQKTREENASRRCEARKTETCWRIGQPASPTRLELDRGSRYRVRVSFNELANCSPTLLVPRFSDLRCWYYHLNREKDGYISQERQRERASKGMSVCDRKRERRLDATRFLPSCNFYDPRKAAIFIGFALLATALVAFFFRFSFCSRHCEPL